MRSYPEIEVYIAVRDEAMIFLKDEVNVLSTAELKNHKRDFGYVREIATNLNGEHPIYSFLKESSITIPTAREVLNEESKLCVICPTGVLPTKSMSSEQIRKEEQLAFYSGFKVRVNDGWNDINEAGYVVGVESPLLFEAASRGIKTKLIPTGLGTNLYNLMFGKMEAARNAR